MNDGRKGCRSWECANSWMVACSITRSHWSLTLRAAGRGPSSSRCDWRRSCESRHPPSFAEALLLDLPLPSSRPLGA